MEVVLMQDVPKTGKRGDILNVSKGFGVNYLIPRKLAELATPEAIRTATVALSHKSKKQEEAHDLVNRISKKYEGKEVRMMVKASKGGRMFGSVGASEIVKQLERTWATSGKGIEIKVALVQPVRDVGRYPLDVTMRIKDFELTVGIVLSVIGE